MRRMKDDELERYVSKLNQKREGLLSSLIKLEVKRRDAQKQLERRMRKRSKGTVNWTAPVLDAMLNNLLDDTVNTVLASPKDDGLDIPEDLKRDSKHKDAEAAEQIKAELAETKKATAAKSALKQKIKREVRQADLTGQRRKMPLEGKAALAALRS